MTTALQKCAGVRTIALDYAPDTAYYRDMNNVRREYTVTVVDLHGAREVPIYAVTMTEAWSWAAVVYAPAVVKGIKVPR